MTLRNLCLLFLVLGELTFQNQIHGQAHGVVRSVYIGLSHEPWSLQINSDGSGSLSHSGVPWTLIRIPTATFDFNAVLSVAGRSIAKAPKAPDRASDPDGYFSALTNADLNVSLVKADDPGFQTRLGTFTPEIKGLFDVALQQEMPWAMREMTNSNPVFSDRMLLAIGKWTHDDTVSQRASTVSPLDSHVPSARTVLSQNLLNDSSSDQGQMKHAPAIQSIIPSPESESPKDFSDSRKSFRTRGWLVGILLCIGAYLAFRFIKLRSGS